MATVFEFVMGSHGEPDVGIFSFEERVTVIFHGEDEPPEPEDTKEQIRALLSELADGYCQDRAEYENACTDLYVQEELQRLEWERDHAKDTPTHE